MAGSDREAAMAAAREAADQKLADALEKLTSAIQNGLAAGGAGGAGSGAGPGRGGGGPSPLAPGQPGFIGPPPATGWANAGKALGNAYSSGGATEDYSGAKKWGRAGEAMASGILGPLAGPTSIASYGVSMFNNVIQSKMNYVNAGVGALGNAPTTDTETMARSRARSALRLQANERDDAAEETLMRAGDKGALENRVNLANVRRQYLQEDADEFDPEARTQARLKAMFGGYARAGGLRGEKGAEGRKLLDKMHDIIYAQEDRSQDFERVQRVRDKRLDAASPGVSSAQGAH